ncbi:MAG: general secretion pathway protein GspK [Xanthomonadales bacterium]|nr:general secretion pathway protein GspK [Xanthomonadales bacterium]
MSSLRPQRGIAFIIVLWVIALVAILMGSFAVVARTENLQARHLLDSVRGRYAAEAGVNLAAYAMRRSDPLTRWVPDGRPYKLQLGDADVVIKVLDDSGKIDINRADPAVLTRLFESVGVERDQAQSLAARISDWRDPDDNTQINGAEEPDYDSAGLSYGPTNQPFSTVGEVQQVMGINYDLFRKLQPALTVDSGSGSPNPMYAPQQAMMALPGMTSDLAQQLIHMRQQLPPGQGGGLSGLTLPDGTPLVASGGGVTYSVQSTSTLPNGATTTLHVTIRLGGNSAASARPFVILSWREGDNT